MYMHTYMHTYICMVLWVGVSGKMSTVGDLVAGEKVPLQGGFSKESTV